MRYFILRQHPFFADGFQLNKWQEIINSNWICKQDFYKTPARCILTASMREHTPFPDFVNDPFPLMSDMMMELVELYGEPAFQRDVVVINERERQSKHYHLVLLETAGQGHVLLGESNLFYMDLNEQREIIISQDFAESALRRGAVGFALEEIDI